MITKKLVIFSPGVYQSIGHAFDYVGGLGSALDAEGVEGHVVGFEGPRMLPGALHQHAVGRAGSGTHRATSLLAGVQWGIKRIFDQERLLAELHRVVAMVGADHVLFETFEYVTLARHIGKLDVPYSVIVHDTNFNAQHQSPVAAAYKTLVRSLVRRIVVGADRAFVHGAGMRDNLADLLRLPVAPAVLPYGAPPPPDDVMNQDDARAHLGLHTDAQVLLAFGTLRDDKNFPLLFEALGRAPKWTLLIAGPESSLTYERLRVQAAAAGVADRIIERPGYIDVDEHEAYFRAADAVTAIYDPSIRHESGTAQLARTYLTPVVACGPPDLKLYVESEGVGWFAHEPDPEAVGAVLRTIADRDSEERAAMEAQIRQCAMGRSWPAVARRYLEQVPIEAFSESRSDELKLTCA